MYDKKIYIKNVLSELEGYPVLLSVNKIDNDRKVLEIRGRCIMIIEERCLAFIEMQGGIHGWVSLSELFTSKEELKDGKLDPINIKITKRSLLDLISLT